MARRSPGSEVMRVISEHEADYVKGNRFFSSRTIAAMPALRLFGNAGLSFLTKLSTGYWDLFDPTNGYTAIEAQVARELPVDALHKRYFFESDMLFQLAVLRARVVEGRLEEARPLEGAAWGFVSSRALRWTPAMVELLEERTTGAAVLLRSVPTLVRRESSRNPWERATPSRSGLDPPGRNSPKLPDPCFT